MPKNQKKGFIIAIDGPDGVGKTTQVGLLRDYFVSNKKRVHVTRSSGGTPIGEELRKVSLSSYSRPAVTDLFISLAMGSALAEDLSIRKKRGETIIIDRSPLSVIAYNGFGSELEDKKIAFDACEALFKRWRIDVLVFLDAPLEVIHKRREARKASDYFENQNDAFHVRVHEGYQAGLEFVQRSGNELATKISIVDASSDITTVQQSIIEKLSDT